MPIFIYKAKKEIVFMFILIFAVGVILGWSIPAEAKGYRSHSRSHSSWYRSKPRTVIHKQTTIFSKTNNNTGGGMGFLGTAAATAGGVVAGNAISNMFEGEPTPVQPQVTQPVQPVQNIVPDLTCPENFVCKYLNGAWQLTPVQK